VKKENQGVLSHIITKKESEETSVKSVEETKKSGNEEKEHGKQM